jgi:pyruvate/2-oxoglutarate dehydrogenase complex dihydrolipoamide acyltransferase (E2) component
MPITPVTMPQLGESVTEGTIGKWLKQPGDTVEKYESLAEVITDKVNAEIPSPVGGIIKELKVEEGATVPVGTEILSIDEGGDAVSAPAPHLTETQAAAPTPAPAPAAVAEAPAPAPVQPTPAPAPAAAAPASGENGRSQPQYQPQPSMPGDMTASVAAAMPQGPAEMYTGTNAAPAAGGSETEEELLRRRSTPAVRRLAEEHAVNLSAVQGTGLGGRVTKEDILQYVAQRGAAPAAPTPAPAQPTAAPVPATPAPGRAPAPAPATPVAPPAPLMGDTPMGLTPMRRAIARHMVESVHTSPHAWTTIEIDMTNVVKYRDSIKAEFEKREGIPVTYYAFFIKAVVEAVKQVPQTNAIWSDEQGIILRREVNVSVPIELGDQGLIAPVIHGADNLSVTGIARKLSELAEKARAGKLTLAEIEGGTITVNNTGSLGVVMTHSIINQPQACLVTMEAIVKRPVVIDDAIAIRSMMYSTIALDHRILDGAVGARFLRTVKQSIEGFSGANSGL